MLSDSGVSATTSNRTLASITSKGPLTSNIVERFEHLGTSNCRGTPTCPLEPLVDRRSTRQPSRLSSQEIRNAQARLCRPPRQRQIHVIVDITYLHGLGHLCIISCVIASAEPPRLPRCAPEALRRVRTPAVGSRVISRWIWPATSTDRRWTCTTWSRRITSTIRGSASEDGEFRNVAEDRVVGHESQVQSNGCAGDPSVCLGWAALNAQRAPSRMPSTRRR